MGISLGSSGPSPGRGLTPPGKQRVLPPPGSGGGDSGDGEIWCPILKPAGTSSLHRDLMGAEGPAYPWCCHKRAGRSRLRSSLCLPETDSESQRLCVCVKDGGGGMYVCVVHMLACTESMSVYKLGPVPCSGASWADSKIKAIR